jgi:hypothetical protein
MKLKYPGTHKAFPANMNFPSWSFIRGQIIFSRSTMNETEIHFFSPNGTAQFLRNGSFPIWIDNGEAIAFLRLEWDESMSRNVNYGDLYRYDFVSNKETLLLKDQKVTFIASTTNGKQIAFSKFDHPGSIFIMNSDGSEEREIVKDKAGSFSWDPDGTSLIYSQDCLIFKLSLDGKVHLPLDLPNEYCYWYASIQPNPN